jgi:hypothetical protein
MGLISFLFRRRNEFTQYETTNWDSPDLQPIHGVTLQMFVEAMRAREAPGAAMTTTAAMAEQAGMSHYDWQQGYLGWQTRLTTSTEVKAAVTKLYSPGVTFRRTYGI